MIIKEYTGFLETPKKKVTKKNKTVKNTVKTEHRTEKVENGGKEKKAED